jgi:hypothetical protein
MLASRRVQSNPRKPASTVQLERELAMSKTHEKLLVATLAGLIIAGAGLLAIQPAFAFGML